jgi:hypothetical protein
MTYEKRLKSFSRHIVYTLKHNLVSSNKYQHMSATNTIIKVIFIATAITLVLYGLQDVRAISNTVAGITKIINRTPLIGMLTSYIGVNLTAFTRE